MKKILKTLFIIIILLAAAVLCGLLKAIFLPPQPVIPEYARVSEKNAAPGTVISYRAEVTLPADMKIGKYLFHAPGTQPGTISAELKSWRWDRNKWEISGNFRVLDGKEVKDGTISFSTAKLFRSATSQETVKIPEISVELPENTVTDEELFLAPETFEKNPDASPWYRRSRLPAAVGILLAAAAAVGIYLFLRRRKETRIPLETAVIREIRRTALAVRESDIRPENGFAILCDILRGYLEKRFSLPVTRCTTEEFIRNMDVEKLLPERREQLFLTGFLNSADLIKFAGANADKLKFDRAAAQAEELVNATTPEEKKK